MYTLPEAATVRPRAAAGRKKRGFKRSALLFPAILRAVALPVMQAAGIFLFSFVRWFGVPSPFGAALLLSVSRKPSPLWLLGLGMSLGLRALWGIELDVWQYVSCVGLWALKRKFHPHPGIETAALGGLSMMPRLFAAMACGTPLDILLSCAAVPLCMLASAALRCGMDAVSSMGAPTCARERVGVMLAALLAVCGLGYFRVGMVNLGHAAATLLVLAYAGANGAIYGMSGGMLCALALNVSGHEAALIPALGFCGLFGGLPPLAKRRWLCALAALCAAGLALFVTRLNSAPLSFYAAGIGGIGYALLPNGMLEKIQIGLRGVQPNARSMESAFVSQRIAHMQQAVQELARALPPCQSDELSIGAELGVVLCAQCLNRELCWGRSRERTERMLCAMMDLSRKGEAIDESKLPALAEHGCLRAAAITEAAQDAMNAHTHRLIAAKKARYERELTLTHLSALSGTLGELGRMAAGESLNDLQAAHVITLALEELHVPAHLSYARRMDGHLQAALETEGVLPIQKPLETLLRYLAKEEDMPLSISRAEHGRVELEEIPLYSASVGMASVSAGEKGDASEVCGDACSAKRCEGGRLLMMLCDGMGHGQAAHEQSEKTLELLMLLLEAGYTRRQAITAVNGIMLGVQEDERFSTVDLVDVDLWTGDVFSEKLGACASWVVRGNHMKKIEGSSLPLGIMEEASPTAAQYRLHSGDILVLMSDGVADAFQSDEELRRVLLESLYIQPQRMADALLRNALLAGGGTPRDDMSVMVLLMVNRQQV